MTGITSFGVYVPWRRLGKETRDWNAAGEKAAANWDENSLTMAVAAAIDCLPDAGRENIDGLYFASTTSPYAEKLAATTAAWTLGLRRDIVTADITDTLRAGTGALRMAADAVRAGTAAKVLVTASDRRTGAGGMDAGFGDGAAAFLIGNENVIAEIEASYSVNNELLDVWRASGAKNVRSWEDRFVFEEGYLKVMPAAIGDFLKKNNLSVKDIDKAVVYGPDLRRHHQLTAMLGLKPEQVAEPLFEKTGNTGSAFVLMMLAGSLEEAKAGDKIIVAGYGDGADLILLRVTDIITSGNKGRGLKGWLNSKTYLRSMEEYSAICAFSGQDPEKNPFGASASVIHRERDAIYALRGVKCKTCGTPQYPPQRVCTKCQAKDSFEPYSFADKKGKVFTFTLKHAGDIPSFARPGIDTIVDFEGGGRAIFGMTDAIAENVKAGMDVEMSFRRLGAAGGIHNYFWRCIPPRFGGETQKG